MIKSRRRAALLLPVAVLFVLLLIAAQASVHAQQSAAQPAERERGITLYKQGDIKGAIKSLQSAIKNNKDDADAWYSLGLALNRDNDVKGARQAFETAVKLRPDFAPAHVGLAYLLLRSNKSKEAAQEAERALALNGQSEVAHYVIGTVRLREGANAKALEEAEASLKAKAEYPPALLIKSQALFGLYLSETPDSGEAILQDTKESRALRSARLKEAAESLEKYLKLEPNTADANVWREQLETLRYYTGLHNRPGDEQVVYPSAEGVVRARILRRTEPTYTEVARREGVEGTVVLRAVFSSDGTVKHILVIRGLPYGLTQEAIQAARKIKFVPATKEGKPVSQFIQIEYNFSLY